MVDSPGLEHRRGLSPHPAIQLLHSSSRFCCYPVQIYCTLSRSHACTRLHGQRIIASPVDFCAAAKCACCVQVCGYPASISGCYGTDQCIHGLGQELTWPTGVATQLPIKLLTQGTGADVRRASFAFVIVYDLITAAPCSCFQGPVSGQSNTMQP